MNRNNLIGFLLIGLLVAGYVYVNQPSKEQLQKEQKKQDSLHAVKVKDSIANLHPVAIKKDSVNVADTTKKVKVAAKIFSDSSAAASGKPVVLENADLKVSIAALGGKLSSVQLKKFKDFKGGTVDLANPRTTHFGFSFYVGDNVVNTDSLVFSTVESDTKHAVLRAQISPARFLEQEYSLNANTHLLDYKFRIVGMDSLIPRNQTYVTFSWKTPLNALEKNISYERTYSTIYYKFNGENGDVEYMSETSDEEKKPVAGLKWISFKQQFFNTTLIASSPMTDAHLQTQTFVDSQFVKNCSAEFNFNYEHKPMQEYSLQWYFGENDYGKLKTLNNGMDKLVPLGWGIFGWVNKFLIIPIFNFLNGVNLNYGLIILILTLIIKVILFPLTYRSMKSAAKMRILKPDIDALKEKFKDDQGKFGQEQMKLYQRAGVNPLGGCLPMLFQIPILFAMYRFFPASVELRHQSFLWAHDLSSYDSIWDFHSSVPFIGDHLSLFCILTTLSQVLFTYYNNQLTSVTGPMKWMQYILPVMFIGIFNSLPSALTYYYFLQNMTGFAQQWITQRFFIDSKAIHQQIEENKKKPKKRSGFMARLEEMQKKQQANARKK